MTPERQRWWDSLPKEEKRVRMDIDEFKRMIRHNKKHLIPYVAFAKYIVYVTTKKQSKHCASRLQCDQSCLNIRDTSLTNAHDAEKAR